MPIDTWTNEQLDELYELARRASEGEWKWMRTPTKTVNAAVRWIAKTTRKSGGTSIWGLFIGPTDDPQIVAYTGNGPTSEANSAYLVAVQPRNVRSLIDDLLHARRQVRDLTTERDYARQQRDEARSELVRLRSEGIPEGS